MFILIKYMQGFIQAILMSVLRQKKLNLTIEFWNSVFIYKFCFCFCWITLLLKFIGSSVFSNQNLELSICFVYAVVWISSHILTCITYLNIQKMKIQSLSTFGNIVPDNLFLQPQKEMYLVKSKKEHCNKLHYSSFYFSKRLDPSALFWNWKNKLKQNYASSTCKFSLLQTWFPVLCRHVPTFECSIARVDISP